MITSVGTLLMVVVTILYLRRNWKLVEMNGARKSYLDPAFLLSALTVVVGVMLSYFIAIDENRIAF